MLYHLFCQHGLDFVLLDVVYLVSIADLDSDCLGVYSVSSYMRDGNTRGGNRDGVVVLLLTVVECAVYP